jgi:hypothetical protein
MTKVSILAFSYSLCAGRLCSLVLRCCTAVANVEGVTKAYWGNESSVA